MDATLERVFSLEIPPRPEFVSVVRLVVSTAAKSRRQLADDRVEDLALAISEACTNAIEAHESQSAGERVEVSIDESEDRIVITIADRGPGFDPLEVQSPPPVTDPSRLQHERGLGIPIIRTLVDEVTFCSGSDGTTVTMVVLCEPAPIPAEFEDADIADLDELLDELA